MATSLRRGLIRAAIILLTIVVVAIVGLVRGSLPELDGRIAVTGLNGTARIARDDIGVPLIEGESRADVAYALGYAHGQDRFYQMDLLRRLAAGELSALVGSLALNEDRKTRLHRFRARAKLALVAMPEDERRLLERYAQGVNDAVDQLKVRPFEYLLLRATPTRWHPEDSLLAIWSMYLDLQGWGESRSVARQWITAHTSASDLAFWLPAGTRFDAPIDGGSVSDLPNLPAAAPAWLALGASAPAGQKVAILDERPPIGSNSWAVAGKRTQTGAAILENDMHLGLALPNTWYRATLRYHDERGRPLEVTGVTLPGIPAVVTGSNGHVAWGFTNSYAHLLDMVPLHRSSADRMLVQTPSGEERATEHIETIEVHGGEPVSLTVLETSWGPIRETTSAAYALHWVAHLPGAANVSFYKAESADSIPELLSIANAAGLPAQNIIVADESGHIGWSIAGVLPNTKEANSTDWHGKRAPKDYPRVVDPPGGALWTANNRPLAGPEGALLGDGGADIGARASQIRDNLVSQGAKVDEHAMLEVSLDDRALFMAPWRDRLLRVLDDRAIAGYPKRAKFRDLVRQDWTGHASIDSVSYRLTRAYFSAIYTVLFQSVDAALKAEHRSASYSRANSYWPVVAERLLDATPQSWLKAEQSTQSLNLAAVDLAIERVEKESGSLEQASWGRRNQANVHHSLSFLPLIGSWLAAPKVALPGDDFMPRVAAPDFGASERLVVSPGRERDGIFNMPGGQSGHPLSPYFLKGHDEWAAGRPMPLLPGPARHTLTFVPAS